jgi:flagellar hook-associated protein 2
MSIAGTTSRITGLASNLDTESIVRDLLKVSKLKITEVERKKQILEWKQELYKEVTTNLYNFQTKYFNGTSSLLGDTLTKLKATSNSSYVTAESSSSSSSGNIYIEDIVSLATNTKLTGSCAVSENPTIDIDTDKLDGLKGEKIVINLDGTEKTLVFSDKTYNCADDVRAELQALLDSSFGAGRANVSLDGNILTLSAENSRIMIKQPTEDGDPSKVLNFNSFAANRIDMNVSLGSAGLALSPFDDDDEKIVFSINGKTFDNFTKQNSIYQIMTAINASDAGVKISYSNLTDSFTMVSTETGAASDIVISDISGRFMESLFGTGVKTQGTDAIVRLSTNGSTNPEDLITVTRSSNTIDIDGTVITLHGKAEGETQEKVNITLSRDNDAIIERIKSFVSDYNQLLSSITTKLTEEYDSSYYPLSEEEKSAMSEKEVELWTTKAKTGLLRNDIYLNDIASQLRSIFYSQISELYDDKLSVGSLSDIGISTTNFSDRGKLTIDEAKLTKALASDPEKVIKLFTQRSSVSYSLYATTEQQQKRYRESGVLDRLSDLLKTNLNKVGKKGALINLVGSPTDSFTGETDYYKRIKDLKDKIAVMNDKLIDEENRYWKQFTAMETALAKLNEQSNWIASMMGNNK